MPINEDLKEDLKDLKDIPRLIFLSEGFRGVILPFIDENKDQLVLVRRSTVDYQVEHETVSGIHCSILRDDSKALRIHDMGSTNGTWLNGLAVPQGGIPLNCGDVIRIGSIEFLYEDANTSTKLKTDSKIVVDLSTSQSLAIDRNANLDPYFRPKRINPYIESGLKVTLLVLLCVTLITAVVACIALI